MAKVDWKDADGTVTAVETADGRYGTIYTVSFNYKVGEHWCGGVFTGNAAYKVGDTVYLRYDPDDPDTNDLVTKENRKQLLTWIFVGALVLFFLVVFISGVTKR